MTATPDQRLAATGRLRRQRDWARSLAARLENENARLEYGMGRAAEFLKTLPCECIEHGVMVQSGPAEDDVDGDVETEICGRCAALSDLTRPVAPQIEDLLVDAMREGFNVAPF